MDKITIGTDPEFFLYSKEKQRIISAVGLIGGDKHFPRQLADGFKVQEDNVLVEFNIPPCNTEEEFIANIAKAKHLVEEILPENCILMCAASNYMQDDELDNMQAMEFGCEPDFNCWTKRMNPRPMAEDSNLRSAGGHIHIGLNGLSQKELVHHIRFMDLFLGVPSVLLDTDTERKKLYGKAGAFRPQPWGLEYRTLSNFWLKSDELISWAYKNAMSAVEAAKRYDFDIMSYSAEIQDCINNNKQDLAKDLISKFKINVYENIEHKKTVVC